MLAKTLFILLGISLTYGEIKKHTPLEHQHSEEFLKLSKESPNEDRLFVHLIAHTHDDIGWLKTVDEYYSGTGTR